MDWLPNLVDWLEVRFFQLHLDIYTVEYYKGVCRSMLQYNTVIQKWWVYFMVFVSVLFLIFCCISDWCFVFLLWPQGPAHINVSVPNIDEGNLKGQVLEIKVQSLSETVSSLKEKIAGEIQLPSNKQKLSGKAGFLKDNLSLAYYNVAGGETLSLSLRERGGRKR